MSRPQAAILLLCAAAAWWWIGSRESVDQGPDAATIADAKARAGGILRGRDWGVLIEPIQPGHADVTADQAAALPGQDAAVAETWFGQPDKEVMLNDGRRLRLWWSRLIPRTPDGHPGAAHLMIMTSAEQPLRILEAAEIGGSATIIEHWPGAAPLALAREKP